MTKVCAIHQPNFFPWLGYFDKIRRADVFVFLDDVAYPKSGSGMGSWVNRVRVAVQGEPKWINCAVRRAHGQQLIKEVTIDDTRPWRSQLLRTLEINYKRSKNFRDCMALIEPLVKFETDRLADFNVHAIRTICHALGLAADFRLQSEIGTQSGATALLVEIVKKTGADAYLCGGGASEYQDDGVFKQNGLALIYQNFEPLPYGSDSGFIAGLSVIDYLMKR